MNDRKSMESAMPAELAEMKSDTIRPREYTEDQKRKMRIHIADEIIYRGRWKGTFFDDVIDAAVNEGKLPAISGHLMRLSQGIDMLDTAWSLQEYVRGLVNSYITDEMVEVALIESEEE